MTKSEIRTLVRTRIGEDNTDALLSDVHLDTLLNARNQDVCNAILKTNESFFDVIDQSIDLVDGTSNYDLPDLDSNNRTRVIRISRVEIAYDGTNYHRARPVETQDLPTSNYIDDSYSTLSPAFYLLGDQIYFIPTPTENQTNAVKIWYTQRQLDLIDDDDTPQFPDQYHHILAWGVASDAMSRSGAPVLDLDDASYGDRFENKFQEGLQDLLETVSPRDVSHPKYIVDEGITGYNDSFYPTRGSIN